VFQHHHLITAFTALENVMIPMLGAEEFANEAMRARAETLIDSVGLTRWKDNGAGKLSGGQQQRVAVARALAMGPALLLADEPTGSLDGESVEVVLGLFDQLRSARDVTIVMVTHDTSVAARADRQLVLRDGRLVT